jgi:L-asparaginase
MQKKIYIVYTGGTIGMRGSSRGYEPVSGFLAAQMTRIPELQHSQMPAYMVHEYDPLIDSSNVSPKMWLHIARDIAAHYNAFDGFVVLHGTDTMAYTASALPFMLQGLGKPVIVTGAQIPLCEARNDARENLITALMIAGSCAIPEVCLFFGNRLLRGNRSVKIDAEGFNAFDSPNFPHLGTIGIDIDIRWDLVLAGPDTPEPIVVKALSESRVAALRLFPGISVEVVGNVLAPPIKGLVLETYGMGNAPNSDDRLLEVLSQATRRGVVIVNCTQCLKGRVNMQAYATGNSLAQCGVISGYDMTTEAALAKMFYLFSRNLPAEEVKNQMLQNLRGEITIESNP